MTAWIAAAYALLVVAVAWLSTRASWRARIAFAVCAIAVAFGMWQAVPDTSGWPTRETPPAHAGLVWGQVVEPDLQTGDPGHIDLWLNVGAPSPRAYTVPYSRQLHKQLQHALDEIKHGVPMELGRTRSRTGSHSGGRRTGHAQGQQTHGSQSRMHFYPQPPPGLPPK